MAKKKTQASRRKQRDAASKRRQARVDYVRQRARSDHGGYWHAGAPGLEVGTILVGAEEAAARGIDTTYYRTTGGGTDETPYDPQLVYFSSSREFARGFAVNTAIRDAETGVIFQRGSLYRVEPIGEVRPDPDFIGNVSWCAPQARIVAVEESNVLLSESGGYACTGPYMAWTDGTPIYDERGVYQLSPEQLLSPGMPDWIHHVPPWMPLNQINAALTRTPSGIRASPESNPAVLAGGAEPIDVLVRHRQRAAMLMAQGIEFFSRGGNIDEDALSALVSPVEFAEDDPRLVLAAVHPRDGVIGACVATVADFTGLMTMFIDRVVVAEAWRGRGLASVLLLTGQQLLPRIPDFAAGHCDPWLAPFFAQMGYTVLQPDVPLVLPVHAQQEDVQPIKSGARDCMFYRHGSL